MTTKPTTKLKPDWVDNHTGSMAWNISANITVWCHMPGSKWKISTTLSEKIEPDQGMALALAIQSGRDGDQS